MNLDNRRLREIRLEKRMYQDRLHKAKTPYEKQIYQGKLGCLNQEERNILKRCDVKL